MSFNTFPQNPFPPNSENVDGGGSPYVLPIASAETLGGVKVGNGLNINENGVLSNLNPTPYTPINYSTTEQATGQKWLDGKDIYKLTTLCEIPANQGQGYTHFQTLVPLDASVINCEIVVEDSPNHVSFGGYVPWYVSASIMFAGLDTDGLNVWFGGDHYKGKNTYVTLYYTKVESED